MRINRKLAIQILKYLDENTDFYFPFRIMCANGNDFIEFEPDELEKLKANKKYQTFELWENLQNLDEETLQLMAKGFIEKIVRE